MADILEQLNLPSSVPLDVKTVTSDRTSIRPFQVYRGLQTYDTSAPAGIYVYEGADRTNVPASWTLLAGALTDLETGNLISWDSDATLAEATVNPVPGRVYLVDRAVTSDTVPITSGGTGADNAADARTNLGVDNLIPEAILNQNAADVDEPANFKEWSGTLAEYNALTPDADTFYNITDDALPAGLAGVTLTTDQTITGTKTFDSNIIMQSTVVIPGTIDATRTINFQNEAGTSFGSILGFENAGGVVIDDSIVFTIGSLGNLWIHNGAIQARGIGFGTNGDTAPLSANVLDFYEDALFTLATTEVTLGIQSGRHTRIGDSVFADFSVVFPTNTNVNLVTLTGLPFGIDPIRDSFGSGTMNLAAVTILVSRLNGGVRVLSNGALLSYADLSGSTLFGSVTYQTND